MAIKLQPFLSDGLNDIIVLWNVATLMFKSQH